MWEEGVWECRVMMMIVVVADLTCNQTLNGLFGLDGNPHSNRVSIRRPVAHSHFPLSCHASQVATALPNQTASLQWVTEGRQIGISVIAYMGT